MVVGARSALFLPFPDLGLIVVDEEHETAFKQEDGVVYHARDMAVVRARLSDAPAVLVSATPSLETLANVEAGRYRHVTLERGMAARACPRSRRSTCATRRRSAGASCRRRWSRRCRRRWRAGEQAMLFLNRRGYAPLTLCRACGHRMQCPNCTAWLVEHRARRVLTCHHCGHTEPIPPACPVCAAEGTPGADRPRRGAHHRGGGRACSRTPAAW